jgi:hypothetical protein
MTADDAILGVLLLLLCILVIWLLRPRAKSY